MQTIKIQTLRFIPLLLHVLFKTILYVTTKYNTLLHSIFRIKKQNILFFRKRMQPNSVISVYVGRSISICKDANRIFINLKKGTPLNFQYYFLAGIYRQCAKIHSQSKTMDFFAYLRLA